MQTRDSITQLANPSTQTPVVYDHINNLARVQGQVFDLENERNDLRDEVARLRQQLAEATRPHTMPFVQLHRDEDGAHVFVPRYEQSWGQGADPATHEECCRALRDTLDAVLSVAKFYHPIVARSDWQPTAYALLCRAHLALHSAFALTEEALAYQRGDRDGNGEY